MNPSTNTPGEFLQYAYLSQQVLGRNLMEEYVFRMAVTSIPSLRMRSRTSHQYIREYVY
jgi:hypothetical protein